MNNQARLVGIDDESGRLQQRSADTLRHDAALVRADAMRVACDRRKRRRGHEVAVRAPITGHDKVVWLFLVIIHQLDEAQPGHLAQLDEVLNLERLNEHRRIGVGVTVGRKHLQQT
jgi:hypothetical protein